MTTSNSIFIKICNMVLVQNAKCVKKCEISEKMRNFKYFTEVA